MYPIIPVQFLGTTSDKEEIAHENVLRVRQAEFLLEERDKARQVADKAVAILKQERKTFENVLQNLKDEKQSTERELDSLRSFILLNGFVEAYGNFQRERKTRQAATDETGIHQQSQKPNSSGSPRLR